MTAALTLAFLGAFAAPLLVRRLPRQAGWLLAVLPAGLTLYFARLMQQVSAGALPRVRLRWAAALNVDVLLRGDGLSLLMAILISGVGTLVVVYASGSLKGHKALDRFYAWLILFMASMLGVVLADNLLVLFVFWELTSFSSFMLIGFEHQDEQARAAALRFGSLSTTARAAAVVFFLFVTAHVLGRAAYLSRVPLWDKTLSDELRGHYDRATHALRGPDAPDPRHTGGAETLEDKPCT